MKKWIPTLLCAMVFTAYAQPADALPILGMIPAFAGWMAGLGALGSALVQIGIGLATTMLTNAIFKPDVKNGPRSMTSSSITSGDETPQSFLMGTVATRGNLMAPEYSHGVDGDNRYLTWIVDLSDIPITSLEHVIINGKKALLDGGTDPDYGVSTSHSEFTNGANRRIWFKFYDGTQTVADPMLVAKYGTHPDRPWDATMVCRRIAYVIVTIRFDPEVWKSGKPRIQYVCKGIKLYDPRKDSTNGGSGAHRWGNEATYEYSDNPMVQAYNIFRGITVSPAATISSVNYPAFVYGGGFSNSDLPVSSWATAMNACDVTVAASSPARKKFTSHLEVHMATADDGGEDPLTVVDELMRAATAEIADMGGVIYPRVGAPELPIKFITDDDIIRTRAQDLDPFPALNDAFNAVHPTFIDPNSAWEPKEGPIAKDTVAESDDGRPIVAPVRFKAVTSKDQVQDLASHLLKDNRRFRRHNFVLPPEALMVRLLQVLSWTSASNQYTAKDFEIGRWSLDPQSLMVTVATRERNSADANWSDAGSQPVSQPNVTTLVNIFLLTGWDIQPYTIEASPGVAARPALRAVWDGSRPMQGVKVQVRVAGQTQPFLEATNSSPSSGFMTIIEGIIKNMDYEARGICIVPGRKTQWTAWTPVTAPNIGITSAELEQLILDQLANADQAAIDANAALIAASNAEDAAAAAAQAALDNLNTALEAAGMWSQGGPLAVVKDPIFVNLARTVQAAAGGNNVQYAAQANQAYDEGQSLRWIITATNQTGWVEFRSNISDAFYGIFDSNAFRVEADFTINSGDSVQGTGLMVDWVATDTTIHRVKLHAPDYVGGANGRKVISEIVQRPSSFAGKTLDYVRIRFYANDAGGVLPGTAIKNISLHRLAAQLPTKEEMGGGLVASYIATQTYTKAESDATQAAVQTQIGSLYNGSTGLIDVQLSTLASADSALAGSITNYQASLDQSSYSRKFNFTGDTLDGLTNTTGGTIGYVDSGSSLATIKRSLRMNPALATNRFVQVLPERGLRGRTIRVSGVLWSSIAGTAVRGEARRMTDMTGTTQHDIVLGNNVSVPGSSWTVFSSDIVIPDEDKPVDHIGVRVTATAGADVRLTDLVFLDVTDAKDQVLAAVSTVYLAQANLDSALATMATNASTTFGDLRADANFAQTALAGLNGSVATISATAVVNGVTYAAGFSATSFSGTGVPAGSVMMLWGDYVLAPGSLGTNLLTIGLGGNLLHMDTTGASGTRGLVKAGVGTVNSQTTLEMQAKGSTWAGVTYPTFRLNQTGSAINGTTDYSEARFQSVDDDGITSKLAFEVKVGQYYDFSVRGIFDDCDGMIGIRWYNEAGTSVGSAATQSYSQNTSGQSTTNPKSWPVLWVKGQAPAGAAYGEPFVRKYGTKAGGGGDSNAFFFRPQVGETSAAATEPTYYSPPDTTYIEGGTVITRTLTAQHLMIGTIDAASAVIAALAVESFNLNGYAVAYMNTFTFSQGPDNPSGARNWVLTSTSSEKTLATFKFPRTSGHKTKCTVYCTIAAAGTYSKHDQGTAVFRLYRQKPDTSLVKVAEKVAQSGERGINIPVSFVMFDNDTGDNGGGGTRYYLKAVKWPGAGTNMTPHVDNIVVEVENYRSARI